MNILILLGLAVLDSATGQNVYERLAIRFSLFVAVAPYGWCAIIMLDWLRARRRGAMPAMTPAT